MTLLTSTQILQADLKSDHILFFILGGHKLIVAYCTFPRFPGFRVTKLLEGSKTVWIDKTNKKQMKRNS